MVPDVLIPYALIKLVNQFYLWDPHRTSNSYRTLTRFFSINLPVLLPRPYVLLPYFQFFRSWCDV